MNNYGSPENLKNQIQYNKEIFKESYSKSKFKFFNPIILDPFLFDVKTIINSLREDLRRNFLIISLNQFYPQVILNLKIL